MHSVADEAAGDGVHGVKAVTPAGGERRRFIRAGLTVAEDLVGIVPTVVPAVAPGAVAHAAPVHTPSVALFTHTVGWDRTGSAIKRLTLV